MRRISINELNLAEYKKARNTLLDNTTKLRAMIKHYPVECCFSDYRCVFSTAAEFNELLTMIDLELSLFAG
jgi:hypothetical protein